MPPPPAAFQPTRRRALGTLAMLAGLGSACGEPPRAGVAPALDVAAFQQRRRFAATPSGEIAYVEQGNGPVALFLHGVPLNGLHWRHVMAQMQDLRRCVALDLMGLGHTRIAPQQDVSFTAQAQMVLQFLDALGIAQVDLVGNDSGGGIAQIFAARHPERLRTLTLTNCDTHDNWPPASIRPAIEFARQGVLVDRYAALFGQFDERARRLSNAYADARVLTEEVYRGYIEPLLATPQTRAAFHRYWTSFDPRHTVAVEPLLRRLQVPTLIVWALDDGFFDLRWAHWLRDTIPGAQRLVTVPGAKLFFPEDLPQDLVRPLRSFLAAA